MLLSLPVTRCEESWRDFNLMWTSRGAKHHWNTCEEVLVDKTEETSWKMIQLRIFSLFAVAALVIGLAACSKISFLLLITLSHEGTKTLLPEQKPVALLCIGCSLIAPSVLVLFKSIWKVCYKTSKLPRKRTTALVLLFELVASVGVAGLTIALMPHVDIVTNMTILNGVSVLSALLHVIVQSSMRKNKEFLPSSITFIILFVGYSLFLALYIMKDSADVKMMGFAVGGSILMFFNWWENYVRWICEKNRSVFLKDFLKDLTRCKNTLYILCSLLRIIVTICLLSFYVPLARMDWGIVISTPGSEKRTILILFGFRLVSSVLFHWFASAACRIQAVKRCFILLLYLASLAAMALLLTPVVIRYQNYRSSLNTTESINFKSYCDDLENEGHLSSNLFQQLVVDVTQTLCFLDTSNIRLLTGAAASMWIGFGLASLHIWFSNRFCIQWTQDLFTKHMYDGVFMESSLLQSTQIHIQNKNSRNQGKATAMVYLCATMWHETQDEMKKIMNSIFSLDQHRPKKRPTFEDFTFEAHIYVDDAFEHVDGIQEHHLNKYSKDLVKTITDVYGTFKNADEILKKQQPIPDYQVMKTPYGGCLVVTMPHGNKVFIHFKDKELIRLKKRWSQVMYIRYLLDWKRMTKNDRRWQEKNNERTFSTETEKKKRNTFLLTLDGDTDFQPDAVQLLVDHLKTHPRVGAVCGRIHPTGSGPAVWFQKFEYANCHWLQKTTEHVFGYVLCSPGCFSLFRAEALTDDNVMRKYSTKSTEASHYIQYDHGEDRWLSTLLLKRGWKLHYIAASNAYTSAPQNFKELYNQRRRWVPTTLVNMNDLLGFTKDKSKMKTSKLYILYQWFNLITAILTPATICVLVAGSLSFIFSIRSAAALVLTVIPPSVYLGVCFKFREETQMTAAAVLSIMYAFLLSVGIITVIGWMLTEQTILTLSTVFFITMSVIYFTAAILHPNEFPLVFCAWIYILLLPSASILLVIYSLVNMNCVSWGTREIKPASGTADSAVITHQTASYKCWKTELQSLSSEVRLQEDSLSEEEETFWNELLDKYLQPLQSDKKTQEKLQNDLRELRNKTSLRFFSVNALWLLLTFVLQVFEVSIQINIIDLSFEETGDKIQIEPIGFMFFLGFVLSLLFQFIGMLYYRVQSFTDFISTLDTELEQNWKIKHS